MNCWLTYIVLVAACVLSCEPTRAQVSDGNPQGQLAADCSPPAFREHPMRPEVTVAELIFEGDVYDRVGIAKGLENLRLAYGEFGYVNFTAVPETQFHDERQTISMNIDVDEGKQFYVSSISLLGPDDNMLRDSPLQPGNIYNKRLARLFIQEHAPYSVGDATPDSRIHLQLNARAGTLVITFDLRGCPGEEP